MKHLTCRLATAAGILAVVSVQIAYSQSTYPKSVVTIVSPTAPGGSYSIYAQLLADGLEKRLGKPFIVENRPGAGTVTGTHQVARAAPTGHTLLMGATPGLAINVTYRKSLPYDARKDLSPVALFATAPQLLLVNAALPIHSIADIVRISKEKPGSLSFASNGPGTVLHLAGEMMKSMLGIDLLHVPYKGAAPAINDVAAGHVSMMFISIASAGGLLDSGKVRALGVSSREPLETHPQYQPLDRHGLPGFDASLWYMMVAPGGTPKDVVRLLNNEINTVVAEPKVRQRIVDLGAIVIKSPPPEELEGFLNTEIGRWGKVVTAAGLAGSI